MAFWNRRKTPSTDVPVEIQEYYQTEKREHAGIAWLLALGTLIVTIALAAAIFFAGRWIYRQISDNDNKTSETAQNENHDDQGQQKEASESQGTDGSGGDQNTEQKNEGQVDDEAAVNDESGNTDNQSNDTSAESTQSDNTGTTGDQEMAQTGDSMPNTGPGDTVVAIFLAVSALGYITHRLYSSKKTV